HRKPYLPGAVDAVVLGVHRTDLRRQFGVADLLLGGSAVAVFVVGRGGDLGAQLGELVTDRLDTPTQTWPVGISVADTDMLVDVAHAQRSGRSSSAAKKAEALLRIALARFNSAFSRLSRLSSADSSVLTPGRWPASTSACRHHLRTVSGVPIPSNSATLVIAAHSYA